MASSRRLLLVTVICVAPLIGCDPALWNKKGPTTRPAGTMSPETLRQRPSVAMEGTIGSVTYLQGARMMRVRGYGLVVGLGNKGSRNVRPAIREQVLTELRRYRSANPHLTRDLPSPERQIATLDTAVVEVLADIPAGAVKDQHFDVSLRADDPDTQSLAGGYLIPCDLRIFQEGAPGEGKEGRIHACGIHDENKDSHLGELHAHQLLEQAPDWPAQVIAAHIAGTVRLARIAEGVAGFPRHWPMRYAAGQETNRGAVQCPSKPGPIRIRM